MPRDDVAALQRYYPQIYLACHVDHVRKRSTEFHLSAQDSSLLAHLDLDEPVRAGRLARHLGIAASTLSAAIKRLADLGYLERQPRAHDRRQVGLRLTGRGAAAMAAASVLDARRVAGVLRELTSDRRRRAVAGLALLASAARAFQLKHPQRR